MPFSSAAIDRERDKFIEKPNGETSVRVWVSNDTPAEAIPVSGSFNISAPTGPFQITVFNVSDTAADPLPSPLAFRVSVSIRNRSATNTVYFGKTSSLTPDNAATGGWEIGPEEDFNIDLTDDNVFFLIAEPGKTSTVKILEIAST